MLVRLRDVIRDFWRNQIRGPPAFLGRDAAAHLGHGGCSLLWDLCSGRSSSSCCNSGAGREGRGYGAAGSSCREALQRREGLERRRRRVLRLGQGVGTGAWRTGAIARASLLRIGHEDRRQGNGGDGGCGGSDGHLVRRCDWRRSGRRRRRRRRHKRSGGHRRRQHRSLTRRTARGGLRIGLGVGRGLGIVWTLALVRHRSMLGADAAVRRAERSLSGASSCCRAWAVMSRDGGMRTRRRRSHLGARGGGSRGER